jgi:hypothetical protein
MLFGRSVRFVYHSLKPVVVTGTNDHHPSAAIDPEDQLVDAALSQRLTNVPQDASSAIARVVLAEENGSLISHVRNSAMYPPRTMALQQLCVKLHLPLEPSTGRSVGDLPGLPLTVVAKPMPRRGRDGSRS